MPVWVGNFKDLELASNNRMGRECREQAREAGTGADLGTYGQAQGGGIGRHRNTQTGTDMYRQAQRAGTSRYRQAQRGGAARCREQAQEAAQAHLAMSTSQMHTLLISRVFVLEGRV